MAILCHGSHTGVTPYTTQLRLGSVIWELRRGGKSCHAWRPVAIVSESGSRPEAVRLHRGSSRRQWLPAEAAAVAAQLPRGSRWRQRLPAEAEAAAVAASTSRCDPPRVEAAVASSFFRRPTEAPAGDGYLLGGQPARCSGGHSTGSNKPGPGGFHGWWKLVNAQTKDLDIDG
ncbi:Os02g0483300 [Oryza sativa Japonica Group]|uniref:Os02g0483300 protein n=1 Tax=Oryza sativa subsp. japonica TaxID=39947 RepID=A0A0P0VJ32_ORYSJ|nr:Os02g0483300 [Oryza sativa Japonica Group]